MPKISTMKFKGASGSDYDFDVYPYDSNWNENIGAVYFVTRRYQKDDQMYYHDEIYVGQTDDLKERHANHHRAQCFTKHKANALCILLESSEKKRLAIEKDLIDGRNPPCNRQ